MDTAFGSLLLFEQIESDVTQDSQIFGSLVLANTATVFIAAYFAQNLGDSFVSPYPTKNLFILEKNHMWNGFS